MIKRISIVISILMVTGSMSFGQKKESKNKDEMAFETESHNYGSIEYQADGSYSFKFTNHGRKPLVITNVKSSCGCTVPSWPKEPVQPGATAKIDVKYNTMIPGTFNKTVQVFSTANNSPVRLTIMGKVNVRPGQIPDNRNTVKVDSKLDLEEMKAGSNSGKSGNIKKSGTVEVDPIKEAQRKAMGKAASGKKKK